MKPAHIVSFTFGLSFVLLVSCAVQAKEEPKALPAEVQANVHKLLKTGECRGCNLAGAVFTRANLAGAQLEAADLRGASFQLANLVGANLKRANLAGAHLGGADLHKADFSDADLSGAIMTGAYQESARLDRVRISPEITVVERRFPGDVAPLPPVAELAERKEQKPVVVAPVAKASGVQTETKAQEESSVFGRIGGFVGGIFGNGDTKESPRPAQTAAPVSGAAPAVTVASPPPVPKTQEKPVPVVVPVQQQPDAKPAAAGNAGTSLTDSIGAFFGGIFKKEPALTGEQQEKHIAVVTVEAPSKPVVIAPMQEVVPRRRDGAAVTREAVPSPVVEKKKELPIAPAVKDVSATVPRKAVVKKESAAAPEAGAPPSVEGKKMPPGQPAAGTKKMDRNTLSKKKKCVGCDLGGMDLSGMDLEGADLERVDLSGANLDRADLRAANLKGSRLRGASLKDARLQKADLYKADLSNADLNGAVLKDAVLDAAILSGAVGLDLSGVNRGD